MAHFGGPCHTVEQLGLASHGEVFFIPPGREARTDFFKALNNEILKDLSHVSPERLDVPLKLVLKGINQKVS